MEYANASNKNFTFRSEYNTDNLWKILQIIEKSYPFLFEKSFSIILRTFLKITFKAIRINRQRINFMYASPFLNTNGNEKKIGFTLYFRDIFTWLSFVLAFWLAKSYAYTKWSMVYSILRSKQLSLQNQKAISRASLLELQPALYSTFYFSKCVLSHLMVCINFFTSIF